MKKLLAVMFVAALILGACGGNNATKNENNNAGTKTTSVDAEKVVNTSCITCHGQNLEGAGAAPALANVGGHLSKDEILNVIQNGKGGMPGGIIKGADAEAVAEWLSQKK